MPNTDPLKVNQPIANLVMLSDNFGSIEDSVEDDNEPSSFHSIGGTNDSFVMK